MERTHVFVKHGENPEDMSQLVSNDVYRAIPNYAEYHKQNKITANNGSWKVEHDGFVRCSISGAAVGNTCIVKKNDIIVYTGITTVAAGWTQETLVPVQVNDIITLSTNGAPAPADWTRDPFVTNATANNLKWSGCYFVPIKWVNDVTGLPAYKIPEALMMRPPDYTNMESVNRINGTNGGSWTVEKNGYVAVLVSLSSNVFIYASILINGKLMASSIMDNLNQLIDISTIMPVKKDDVVSITVGYTGGSGTILTRIIGCYFIPMIPNPYAFLEKMPPIIIQSTDPGVNSPLTTGTLLFVYEDD